MQFLTFFTNPEVGDHFLRPEGATHNGFPRTQQPAGTKNVRKNNILLAFRPHGLLGPPGAVLCGTLRTQKVVPHLGVGEKRQK